MSEHDYPPQETPPISEPERSPSLEERLSGLEAREQERASQPVTQPSGDFTHTGIELVGRHLPEDHVEVLSQHERRMVQLPGTYELGALIEGAFIPLARLKAAEVLEAVDRAAQSAEQSESDTG